MGFLIFTYAITYAFGAVLFFDVIQRRAPAGENRTLLKWFSLLWPFFCLGAYVLMIAGELTKKAK